MTKTTLTKAALSHFTGSIIWFVHSLVKAVHYTQGVQYVAKKAGAYWLVDLIAFAQAIPAIKAEAFQFWVLTVNDNCTANLRCEDGNGIVIHTHAIEWTDFPLDEIKFYFTDTVLMLTSEY